MKSLIKEIIPRRFRSNTLEIPVVRLEGTIMVSKKAFDNSLSLAKCCKNLEDAFKTKDSPVVALSINSPGGSATQSHLIYNYIRSLAQEYNKHVIAFVEDVAASGGYMIACAADEIYADKTSIVGSIGVVTAGFGLQDMIKKIGIERRVYTAGKNKFSLDSFSPEKPEDVEHLKKQLLQIHDVFIKLVQERRKSKLSDNEDLFTGMFWTAIEGKELGLIDDWDNIHNFVKKHYGKDTKLKFINTTKGFIGKILGNQETNLIARGLEHLKEESLWARYGL